MTGLLEGKVALVTGASSGIGRATALAFAREGARVVFSDVNAEGGEETVSMISKAGGEGIFVHADVSKAADVEAMGNKTIMVYGRLDCAFNNAGIAVGGGPIHEDSEENWNRIISINLKGVWLCMKYEIPQMLKQGEGAIVNTSSVAGLVGYAINPIYSASKHGIVGLTKSAALQYAKAGIRINVVCPGIILTPMVHDLSEDSELEKWALGHVPEGRLGKPEEVAAAVVWLCSDTTSYVTGAVIPVDGGSITGIT